MFWWVGMKDPSLQIMAHGKNIGQTEVRIASQAVRFERSTRTNNPNYLFIDVRILSEAATSFDIEFWDGRKKVATYAYALHERTAGSAQRKGFNNSDAIYLITPDRFANALPANDNAAGYVDKANRQHPFGRHGGDIEGIIQHLDYIKEMGFTALWVCPMQENNQQEASYHGYAITDFYKIDPRFGSNEDYRRLCQEANKRGIKLIMDMVANHCGNGHWWMNDPPALDWFNYQEGYRITNHRRSTIQDPHTPPSERRLFEEGWFVSAMPDMNQRNPLMGKYFLQNTIWWIEYAGLQGIRMDTYSYPDADYMREWSCRVMEEYPDFNIVGEEWATNPLTVAYWQRGKQNPNGYVSCLPSLMDFPLQDALRRGLVEPESWNKGFIAPYEMLANDFAYANPNNLVVFADNHDMDRFFTQMGEDLDLFKMGMAYVFTMRGIPQLYYGTEVLLSNKGFHDNHGIIRTDFPGGWASDKANAFTGDGLSSQQAEAQAFVRRLANWRKGKEVVQTGKLTHYSPTDGVYVYFRYNDSDKVMVVFNKNDKASRLEMSRFNEVLGTAKAGRDVLSEKSFSLVGNMDVPPRAALVLEVR